MMNDEEDEDDGREPTITILPRRAGASPLMAVPLAPAARFREKEEVSVPVFASVSQLVQWRIQVSKNLCSASGYWDQAEMAWFFVDGYGPGISSETLSDSGGERFRSLDLKLSTSLGK
eukprot:14047376-Heterocapsa_arctica.AAC.1